MRHSYTKFRLKVIQPIIKENIINNSKIQNASEQKLKPMQYITRISEQEAVVIASKMISHQLRTNSQILYQSNDAIICFYDMTLFFVAANEYSRIRIDLSSCATKILITKDLFVILCEQEIISVKIDKIYRVPIQQATNIFTINDKIYVQVGATLFRFNQQLKKLFVFKIPQSVEFYQYADIVYSIQYEQQQFRIKKVNFEPFSEHNADNMIQVRQHPTVNYFGIIDWSRKSRVGSINMMNGEFIASAEMQKQQEFINKQYWTDYSKENKVFAQFINKIQKQNLPQVVLSSIIKLNKVLDLQYTIFEQFIIFCNNDFKIITAYDMHQTQLISEIEPDISSQAALRIINNNIYHFCDNGIRLVAQCDNIIPNFNVIAGVVNRKIKVEQISRYSEVFHYFSVSIIKQWDFDGSHCYFRLLSNDAHIFDQPFLFKTVQIDYGLIIVLPMNTNCQSGIFDMMDYKFTPYNIILLKDVTQHDCYETIEKVFGTAFIELRKQYERNQKASDLLGFQKHCHQKAEGQIEEDGLKFDLDM